MAVPIFTAAAAQSAEIIWELMADLKPEEAEIIWQYMGLPGVYPGLEEARPILLAVAVSEGWNVTVRRTAWRAMRALIGRDIATLRLLLGLLIADLGWWTTFLIGRDERLMPRAGHGSTAPVRGSPRMWFVSPALPGAPP